MSQFTSILVVSPMADGKTWVLREAFGFDVGSKDSGDRIVMPVGFLTDFATIPRPFWIFLPKWGKYGNAAVGRDWLYWEQPDNRHRASADAVLLDGMRVLSVNTITRYVIYCAVRLFGWIAWIRNQADRESEYPRALSALPIKATKSSQQRGQYVQLTRFALKRTGILRTIHALSP